MSDTPSPVRTHDSSLLRYIRYGYRLPLLLWHVLIDLPLILIFMTPLTGGIMLKGKRLDHHLIQLWQLGLLRVFGIRMGQRGEQVKGGALFVANHVSWIDIVSLHSQRMVGFVAKKEIEGWPVVGWLAARGETIFHKRGNQDSLQGVLEEMAERLKNGRSVAVFPEGGTRDGVTLGPFHARIFSAAVDAQVTIQPVALVYGNHADAQSIVAFRKKENFMQNFIRLLGEPSRPAWVVFLQPIYPQEMDGRRHIAELARERIQAALESA